jgi:hypothetical protein
VFGDADGEAIDALAVVVGDAAVPWADAGEAVDAEGGTAKPPVACPTPPCMNRGNELLAAAPAPCNGDAAAEADGESFPADASCG